ncbi:MAG: polysaccharide export outer membrane protein [Candidatus Latescibacterota bacterium]|jgi:polysaccharide export outer membrane protein
MKVKFLGLLLLVFLQSCKSKKEMFYMQDINAYNNTEVTYANPTLQPNDILKITVGALVAETAIPYNRITSMMTQTNSLEMMQLEGYLVSLEQTISFPILGEISVANKSITQLEKDLSSRLESGGHLTNPSVNVRLLNAKVTILGEVKMPGTYSFTENNINLLQALGLAGDLTINGERNDVVLIREVDGVRTVAHFDLTKSSWLESPYYLIKPNDVIMINPNGSKVKSAGFIGTSTSIVAIASLIISSLILITN